MTVWEAALAHLLVDRLAGTSEGDKRFRYFLSFHLFLLFIFINTNIIIIIILAASFIIRICNFGLCLSVGNVETMQSKWKKNEKKEKNKKQIGSMPKPRKSCNDFVCILLGYSVGWDDREFTGSVVVGVWCSVRSCLSMRFVVPTGPNDVRCARLCVNVLQIGRCFHCFVGCWNRFWRMCEESNRARPNRNIEIQMNTENFWQINQADKSAGVEKFIDWDIKRLLALGRASTLISKWGPHRIVTSVADSAEADFQPTQLD